MAAKYRSRMEKARALLNKAISEIDMYHCKAAKASIKLAIACTYRASPSSRAPNKSAKMTVSKVMQIKSLILSHPHSTQAQIAASAVVNPGRVSEVNRGQHDHLIGLPVKWKNSGSKTWRQTHGI